MKLQKERIKMPQTEIEIHFQKMKALCDRLSETADGLEKLVDTEGMNLVSEIKAAWISPNADIYTGKEIQIMGQVQEIAGLLRELSVDMEEKVKRMYEVEKWNALTANMRIYC